MFHLNIMYYEKVHQHHHHRRPRHCCADFLQQQQETEHQAGRSSDHHKRDDCRERLLHRRRLCLLRKHPRSNLRRPQQRSADLQGGKRLGGKPDPDVLRSFGWRAPVASRTRIPESRRGRYRKTLPHFDGFGRGADTGSLDGEPL